MLLRGFPASPFVQKARLLLQFKGVPFDEEPARLFSGATLSHFVEALEEPTLVDGDTTIGGATAIAQYLDQSHPDRPLYPASVGASARLVEQWVDRVLVPATLAVRWLMRANFSRSWQDLAAKYGHLAGADLLAPALRPAFREIVALRVEGAPSFFGRDAARIGRLSAACEALDAALAETRCLCGPSPTAADLAAYAGLVGLEEMDGWETVRGWKRIPAWMKTVAKMLGTSPGAEGIGAEEIDVAEAQASVDARRLFQGPSA